MKKLFFILLSVLGAGYAIAQKTIVDPNVQVRSIKGFTAISVSGGIDLYLSSGDEAVAVSAKDAETTNLIKTEVKDGVLKIYFDGKWSNGTFFANNKALKAYVSYKKLTSLNGSGGSDILVDGTIQGDRLALSISGGSDFKGKIDVQELRVDASGGSDIDVTGRAGKLVAHVSGGSDFNGYGFVTESASVEASGGSDVEIAVNKNISARASGGSDIRYKGNASETEISSSGSGSVKKTGK